MRRSPQKEGGFLGKAGREGAFPGGGIESASRRSWCLGGSRPSRGWSARTRRGEATCRPRRRGGIAPHAGEDGRAPGRSFRAPARAHPSIEAKGPAPQARSRMWKAGRFRPDRLPRNGFARGLRPLQGSGGSGIGVRFDARDRERVSSGCFGIAARGPAAGSVGVRFDRGEPRRGLRVRGSLRGSKVPRCAVSGFASMPGSRRRSLRRVRSPRGRQAVRNGRSRRVRIDRGGRRRFRSSAEPGDGGEARALRSFETGLFEARRRARAGLRVSETGFGHPGLGLARVPQGTAQALAAWTGPAGTGKAASAPPRCPPTQRVMALPRHGRS